MISIRDRIVEKLEQLPEPKLREVLAFVDFLTWRVEDQDEPLLSIASALSGNPLSAKEIEDKLYGDGEEEER